MTIRTEDVKLKKPQRLTDLDNGGGFMTNAEVVDGQINNLFPNIGRITSTIGQVRLRQAFMAIDNDADVALQNAPNDWVPETANECHLILGQKAENPSVNVCLFTLGGSGALRSEAQNRLESYVTVGARYVGWLWADQPQGTRQLRIFQGVNMPLPAAGSVFCLYKDRGLSSERSQYVRVTRSEDSSVSFNIIDATGQNTGEFHRRVLTVDISDPLEFTVPGVEMHNDDKTPTNIYTTVVSDAARYYGAAALRQPIQTGDTSIFLESVFNQLVPTNQSETPMINLTLASMFQPVPSGVTQTLSGNPKGTRFFIGRAVVPGSVSIEGVSGGAITAGGNGVLMQGSAQRGTINFVTGLIEFSGAINQNITVTYDPGAIQLSLPETLLVDVPLIDRGFNYVNMVWPPPKPGWFAVDYMAQGKWYRLFDDGAGNLTPAIADTGTGRVDYQTGQFSITCAALPDPGVPILVYAGRPWDILQMAGDVPIHLDPVRIQTAESPVAPGSLSITWGVGATGTATATDDGEGNIIGDAVGWINYGSGEMELTPNSLPAAGTELRINYEKYAPQIFAANGVIFTLPNPPAPGSVSLSVPMTFGNYTHTYTLRDDGKGGLSAPGFTAILSQVYSDTQGYQDITTGTVNVSGGYTNQTTITSSTMSGDFSSANMETKTLTAGGIGGTVDYVTGNVTLDLSAAEWSIQSIGSSSKKNNMSGELKVKTFRLA